MDADMMHGVIKELTTPTAEEKKVLDSRNLAPPCRDAITEIMDLVKSIVFPGFYGECGSNHMVSHYVGVNVDRLYGMIRDQVGRSLNFKTHDCHNESACTKKDKYENDSDYIADAFMLQLPEVKRLLYTDVQAIYNNDPAVGNYGEVILCYPVVQAMLHYRTAHALLGLGVPVIPRVITEMAHSATGIDIHPGATIGEYFAIDHGTGVVIGETSVIGNNVTIYQGVTLGAKNFSLDSEGHPLNIPRHPVIEDRVTIYANSTVLGRITIGHDSIIGGNVWLTHDVAPHSKILQSKAAIISD